MATDEEVFRLGDQLIDILANSNNAFANAVEKQTAKKSKNPCGIIHFNTTTHLRNKCHANPKKRQQTRG